MSEQEPSAITGALYIQGHRSTGASLLYILRRLHAFGGNTYTRHAKTFFANTSDRAYRSRETTLEAAERYVPAVLEQNSAPLYGASMTDF